MNAQDFLTSRPRLGMSWPVLAAAGLSIGSLVLLAGCEDEPRYAGKAKTATSKAKASSAEKVEPREILGKRTQDIRAVEPEVANKGAQVITKPRIVAKDPITLQGNAYVTMIGQTSILQIEHAMNLYHAENNAYPKNLQEFMDGIVKPNNIRLPVLPYYQEYGYDEANHRLVILEYPDRKQ